ncbi:hypothetical protein wVul_0248 [Wolbachia endosymbiont of Armadillidium vulgare str. wVulC]|nr:hypothetical protein wVul_0248 [Wolbachia endosymbiont of Armadillidium vulgare str. wVulC]
MQHCLQQQSYRLHLNYELLAVVSNRAKVPSLLCMSILIRPRIKNMVEAPSTALGSNTPITR